MQPAKLTLHASQRLDQRCTLTEKQFKKLLDKGATVQLSQQRGGRLVHRLFYSIPDDAWLVAVQDDNNGEVLTTLPLAYFENFHGPVTGANRRKARKLARDFEAEKLRQIQQEEEMRAAKKLRHIQQEAEARAAKLARQQKAVEANAQMAAGWKVTIQFDIDGNTTRRNLGRTLPEHGDPETWGEGHSVHTWFRERLDAMCIFVQTLRGVWIERGKANQPGDLLLEHLIVTEEELQRFK